MLETSFGWWMSIVSMDIRDMEPFESINMKNKAIEGIQLSLLTEGKQSNLFSRQNVKMSNPISPPVYLPIYPPKNHLNSTKEK